MAQCQCEQYKVLVGQEAEQYRTMWLKQIAYAEHGWRQLWQCQDCASYWEMYWEGGGGFDDGMIMLRWLSPSELKNRWSGVERQNK